MGNFDFIIDIMVNNEEFFTIEQGSIPVRVKHGAMGTG